MRTLPPLVFLSVALILPASAHASLLARLFFMLRTTTATTPAPKPKLAGQETRAFTLRKAHAQDVLIPLQNYLNGVSKAGGSLQERSGDNAIVVTAAPDTLLKLSALMPEIDQAYDNDNAQARQMLVTQCLMKAIRNHPDVSEPTRGSERSAPVMAAASAPKAVTLPSGPRVHDADDMSPLPKRRWVDTPTLAQFEVVGWMQDEQGYTIILSNEGRRFIYRHGKLHGGYNPKAHLVEGIDGSVRNNQLFLNDGQNHVSLKMLKWHTL